jgi:hypothetical protein
MILGFVLGFTLSNKDRNGGDPRCRLAVKDQDAFAHCACHHTTTGLILSDQEKKYREEVKRVLENHGVVANHTMETCAPQNQCLLWLSNYERRNLTDTEVNLTLKYHEVSVQTYILCLMYLQMDGQHWQEKDGWMEKPMPCEWYGISCSFLSHATGLALPSNGLNGTLPSELSQMEFLSEY